MYTFIRDLAVWRAGGPLQPFVLFFAYVWAVWLWKWAVALFYIPFTDDDGEAYLLRTTVIVPVYNEPPEVFRRVLASILANGPSDLVVVVDGSAPDMAEIARPYARETVLIPKQGKRAAIAAGLAATDPTTDIVVVVDSDTIWEPGMLREMLKPFADPRVGGVTPKQAIFDRDGNPVRRLADWIEDLRYGLVVPAQSVFGQIGCLAGRTIAYRRQAIEAAIPELVSQRLFGLEMTLGDDRVLTSSLLKQGWRTVYQRTAVVWTDAPNTWGTFWRQQLRWGRSSQRETLLSLHWLWRRPVALMGFATDIITPFALFAVFAISVVQTVRGETTPGSYRLPVELAVAFGGMLVSIGLRQLPHFFRHPRDILRLPFFCLALTFLMSPMRIISFATMFHTGWGTRAEDRQEDAAPKPVRARPQRRPSPVHQEVTSSVS